MIGFHLLPGQTVPPHQNPSTVLLQVTKGSGIFRGESGEERLSAGATVVYAPGESHSIQADGEPVRFLAIIAPGPG